MKHKIIKIANIVLIAVFLIAAFNIIRIKLGYNKADTVYTEIQNSVVKETPNEEIPELTKEPSIEIDFDALKSRNDDVVGWLYCPDTVINYPVAQGEDNNQYLRRDLDGKYLVTGTLFADYRNGKVEADSNYIIYGHNMRNSTMFGTLIKYKEQTYYDAHPVFYYLTPEKTYKIELYAGLVIKSDSEIYAINQSASQLDIQISQFKEKSTFKSDVEYTPGDKVITLSTCSYEFEDARYILIGKLT
jgi:sortase B